jgi:hypothetical protein
LARKISRGICLADASKYSLSVIEVL